MGLPCMNCRKEVSPNEGKLFAQCFVCPDCHRVASSILEHGQRELHNLMTTLKELVRLAIVRGELSLSEMPPSAPTVDRMAVIDAIAELARKKKEAECPTPQQPSTEKCSMGITRRRVHIADGVAVSDSTQAQGSSSGIPSTETPPTESSGNA